MSEKYVQPLKDYKQVSAFACQHCSEVYEGKKAIDKHVKECVYNPSNKRCMMCKHVVQYHFMPMHSSGSERQPLISYKCGLLNQLLKTSELNVEKSCFEVTEVRELPIQMTKEAEEWYQNEKNKQDEEAKRLLEVQKASKEFEDSMRLMEEYKKNPENFKDLGVKPN